MHDLKRDMYSVESIDRSISLVDCMEEMGKGKVEMRNRSMVNDGFLGTAGRMGDRCKEQRKLSWLEVVCIIIIIIM